MRTDCGRASAATLGVNAEVFLGQHGAALDQGVAAADGNHVAARRNRRPGVSAW